MKSVQVLNCWRDTFVCGAATQNVKELCRKAYVCGCKVQCKSNAGNLKHFLRRLFVHMQDKINAFWEISKKELEDTKAQLRNKDREMEELEERHQVEIKVALPYSSSAMYSSPCLHVQHKEAHSQIYGRVHPTLSRHSPPSSNSSPPPFQKATCTVTCCQCVWLA